MPNILSEKSVLAGLSVSRWTARRLDRAVTEDVHQRHGAADGSGRYNKRLIAKQGLLTILGLVSGSRAAHTMMTLPWLDTGARLLPSSLYIDYSNRMRDLKARFDAAADAFENNYQALVDDAKQSLGKMFDKDDYPPQDQIRGRFKFNVSILPCPDADDFRVRIAQDQMDDIRADVEQRLADALEAAHRDTVDRIVSTVGHMAERLRKFKPAEKDGDRTEGVFRDSLVENVRDLARVLPAFNLTGNNRIADVAARIEQQLCGADAQTLREDEVLRSETANAAESILSDVRDLMA
jgi:hypothetical protein